MTLEVKELTGGYGQVSVLKKETFTVESGQVVGLIGLNGAGKSTTIKHIIGLLTPRGGQILIDGISLHDDVEKYRKKIKDKPQFAEEELGRVIILLNSNVEIKKSELLAMFYRSYINEEIDWSTFCEFSDITSRLFISDLQLLYEIYRGNISDTSQCPVYKADRLIALGLLDSAMKSMSIGSVSGSQTQRYIQTNNLGKQFCSITLS